MADGCNGFARVIEFGGKLYGALVGAQGIGIHDSTGQHQAMIVGVVCLVKSHIHFIVFSPVGVIPGADGSAFRRNEMGLGAGLFEGLARFRQFYFFKSVGSQNSYLSTVQLMFHNNDNIH